MTATSHVAQCAQWAARRRNGQFGNQNHHDSGIVATPPTPVFLLIEGDDSWSSVGPYPDPATGEAALRDSALIRRLIDAGATSVKIVPAADPLPSGRVVCYDVDDAEPHSIVSPRVGD